MLTWAIVLLTIKIKMISEGTLVIAMLLDFFMVCIIALNFRRK